MSKCGSFKGNKMFIRTLYPLKDQYMQDLNRNDNKIKQDQIMGVLFSSHLYFKTIGEHLYKMSVLVLILNY